jgi:hypothetical protein
MNPTKLQKSPIRVTMRTAPFSVNPGWQDLVAIDTARKAPGVDWEMESPGGGDAGAMSRGAVKIQATSPFCSLS